MSGYGQQALATAALVYGSGPVLTRVRHRCARLKVGWGPAGQQTSSVCWQRPRETEFVTIWIGQVEVALAPFGIAGSGHWENPAARARA